MLYKINNLPLGWVICPPLVATWIKQIKATGQKAGENIVFEVKNLVDALNHLKVPHVADFLIKNTNSESLVFKEVDCSEEIN